MGVQITASYPTSSVPGVDIIATAPRQSLAAQPADIVAHAGTATWGPLNTPTWYPNTAEFRRRFGGMTPHPDNAAKPLNGYVSAKAVSAQGVQDKLFVRVSDNTSSTARLQLRDTAAAAVLDLHGEFPGTRANSFQVTVTAPDTNGNQTLTIVDNSTLGVIEIITGLQTATNAALIAAITSKSQLLNATQPVLASPVVPPTVAVGTTGGTVPAQTAYFVTTNVDATGKETQASPETGPIVTTGGTNTYTFTQTASAGVAHFNVYGSTTGAGQEIYWGQGTPGTPLVITANPATPSTVRPPFGPFDANGTLIAPVTGAGSAVPLMAGTYTFPVTGATPTLTSRPGSDGVNVSAAQAVGLDVTPATGLYVLAGMDPAVTPNVVFLAEDLAYDTTQWLAQAQLAQANSWRALVAFSPTTTDTQAIAALSTLTALTTPPSAAASVVTGDFIQAYWGAVNSYDAEYYNADLVTSPAAWAAGVSAVTSPSRAALNVPIQGDCRPLYTLSDTRAGALINANINPLSARIPLPHAVGLVEDKALSGSDGQGIRLLSIIARAAARVNAPFVGAVNGPDLWLAAGTTVAGMLNDLANHGDLPANPAGQSGIGTPASLSGSTSTATTAAIAIGTAKAKSGAAGAQPSAAAASTTGTATTADQASYWVVIDASNNTATSNQLFEDLYITVGGVVKHIRVRLSPGTQPQAITA